MIGKMFIGLLVGMFLISLVSADCPVGFSCSEGISSDVLVYSTKVSCEKNVESNSEWQWLECTEIGGCEFTSVDVDNCYDYGASGIGCCPYENQVCRVDTEGKGKCEPFVEDLGICSSITDEDVCRAQGLPFKHNSNYAIKQFKLNDSYENEEPFCGDDWLIGDFERSPGDVLTDCIGYRDCYCEWDDDDKDKDGDTNECVAMSDREVGCPGEEPQDLGDCILDCVGSCGEGEEKTTVTCTATVVGGSYGGICEDFSEVVSCRDVVKLGFFNFVNVIVAVFVLIVIYYFLVKRKKSGKGEVVGKDGGKRVEKKEEKK